MLEDFPIPNVQRGNVRGAGSTQVAVDEPPEVGGLWVFGTDEPIPPQLEDVGGALLLVFGFELVESKKNSVVSLDELAEPKGLLGEDPKSWEGRVWRNQRPNYQPVFVGHHVDRIQMFGDPLAVFGFGFPVRVELGVVRHTPEVVR